MALTEKERQESLRSVLIELSESQEILEDKRARAQIYGKLENIYFNANDEQGFRHFYSDIFSCLTQIDMDGDKKSIDVLAQNLAVLRKGYRSINVDRESKQQINISKSLDKLYDHVNLDVARINYLKTVNESLKAAIKIDELSAQAMKLEHETKELKKQTDEVQQTALEAKDEVKGAQRDSTAILGIFAAIVLAFTGGMVFSTSVFENMGNASIYRVGLLSLLIAFTLINLIHMFLDFIAAIGGLDKPGIDIRGINIGLIALAVLTIVAWMIDLPSIVEQFRFWT